MNATKEKLVVLDKKKKTNAKKPKAKRKAGAAKMREAADKIVGRDCKPLIEALSTNGKNGQMLSAKFLYNLAHMAEEAGEAQNARAFRSLALELANSPEWQDGAREGSGDGDDEDLDD
jgi:hypothetical protein